MHAALRHLAPALLAWLALTGTAQAQTATEQVPQKSEVTLAYETAMAAATPGPADVALLNEATLHLPKDYLFVPPTEGTRLMESFGNRTDERFVGLVWPADPQATWFVTVDYNDGGHVKDDEARTWNADELMQSIREGTEESNKLRVEKGIAALDIVDWAEKPAYDATTHRLIWSILARERGAAADESATINYNTYALGRQGYFELNLITSDRTVNADKVHAQALLAGLDFKPGRRYADFDASTDRLAEYGLGALIGGVAAKKLGLLALVSAFLIKAWKFVLLGLVALASFGVRLFRRRGGDTGGA